VVVCVTEGESDANSCDYGAEAVQQATAYDVVPYTSHPYPQTRPERLGALEAGQRDMNQRDAGIDAMGVTS
jgi:hypothetical protein